jgi:hypothetical protein
VNRRCLSGVVLGSVALVMTAIPPVYATTTLAYLTATTSAGRTCTIEFQADSPYRVAPVSSRINYASSVWCTGTGGNLFRIGASAWFPRPNYAARPAESLRYQTADAVGSNLEAAPGDTSASCDGLSNGCSFSAHIYGYPGDSYLLTNDAFVMLPTSTSRNSGERWTSISSPVCSHSVAAVNAQNTLWSDVLRCATANNIRAA